MCPPPLNHMADGRWVLLEAGPLVLHLGAMPARRAMITLEDLYQVDDPLELFELTTRAVSEYQAVLDQMAEIRARALAALYARGHTYKDLADKLGLSAPRIGQLVSANDDAALQVLRAWAPLEKKLHEISESTGGGTQGTILHRTRQTLLNSGRISPKALADLDYIRTVRNKVVHGESVSIDVAEDVEDKAVYLSALLHLVALEETARKTRRRAHPGQDGCPNRASQGAPSYVAPRARQYWSSICTECAVQD